MIIKDYYKLHHFYFKLNKSINNFPVKNPVSRAFDFILKGKKLLDYVNFFFSNKH